MTYSKMFEGQDAKPFEQRRDEVVALVSSAVDLAGVDQGLVALLDRLTAAADESEFNAAFDEVVDGIRGTTARLSNLV